MVRACEARSKAKYNSINFLAEDHSRCEYVIQPAPEYCPHAASRSTVHRLFSSNQPTGRSLQIKASFVVIFFVIMSIVSRLLQPLRAWVPRPVAFKFLARPSVQGRAASLWFKDRMSFLTVGVSLFFPRRQALPCLYGLGSLHCVCKRYQRVCCV